MQKRLNLDNKVDIYSKCFHPKNALNFEFHEEHYEDLDDVFPTFKAVIEFTNSDLKLQINQEWTKLVTHYFSEDIKKQINLKKEADEFCFFF